ncbi:MAG: hypothetical protein JST01_21220 [Cyanobacteria bacterium SZAS TMP-1]|nr:hypothetical protein [Cyanobacteria bacterium SZAS TMP-1]
MPTYIYALIAAFFTFALTLDFTLCAPAWGQSTSEADINATVEPPSEDPQHKARGTLIIRLNVPHMAKRTDEFSINPYTTKPPAIAIPIAMLPESKAGIKQKLLSTGYGQRLSLTKPYPDSGWRWHYCYRRARDKSGIGEPHMFFQMYRFADDLAPYVLPEVKRSNKIEFQRLERYKAFVTEYADNHKDEEMEALRLGHEPIKLKLVPVKRGTILETSLFISPGDWWITGSHKVPGLIYFWQLPVKVHDNETQTVELNEENALLVQGGW